MRFIHSKDDVKLRLVVVVSIVLIVLCVQKDVAQKDLDITRARLQERESADAQNVETTRGLLRAYVIEHNRANRAERMTGLAELPPVEGR